MREAVKHLHVKRKHKPTTKSDPSARFAPNLLAHDGVAHHPNRRMGDGYQSGGEGMPHHIRLQNKQEARSALFGSLERFHHPIRFHSTFQYVSLFAFGQADEERMSPSPRLLRTFSGPGSTVVFIQDRRIPLT